MLKLILIFLLVHYSSNQEYEKFFEVEGGPEYMYYFAKFQVGTPPFEQSAIIDTGSDTLAFPCDSCQNGDCGNHQDPRYIISKSNSFSYDMDCAQQVNYKNQNVCQFIKSYAEGSSLLGFMGFDYIRFKNSHRINDQKLSELNSSLKKDLRIKSEFGCTTKETGLFKTQFADGIMGLDNDSTMIESLEQSFSKKTGKQETMSFGLCLGESGGIMSIDFRSKDRNFEKIHYLDSTSENHSSPLVFEYNTDESYYEIEVEGFQVGRKHIRVDSIYMMVDSGTTFTHFPTSYVNKIIKGLNEYCNTHIQKCGKLGKPNFDVDSCLELKQPDDNYLNVQQLLNSFPDIQIKIANQKQPLILHPKNYFYKEVPDQGSNSKVDRICIALKGEEEGRIILGAFSMIDKYFYFDRVSQKLKVFEENCFLKSKQLLLKKERILEEDDDRAYDVNFTQRVTAIGCFVLFFTGFVIVLIYKKKKQLIKIKRNQNQQEI